MRLYRMRRIYETHSIRLTFAPRNLRLSDHFTVCLRSSLLLPDPLQDIRIPPLPHIDMALDPIHQRCFPQMSPPPFRKCEFHLIDLLSTSPL